MDKLEIKAALSVDDAGTITGLAWPFGSPDRVGDVIEKGAITAPATLPMLFAHDQSQVVGVWDSIAETAEGLTVKGRLLVEDVERAREVRAMIRSKAVTGLSIGFVTKQAKPRNRGRTITALSLHEISVVAVPCHPGAQITSIKAADGTATPHEEISMEPELKNDPAAIAPGETVIEQKALDALKAQMAADRARLDKLEAKANRPAAANNNHPNAENDNLVLKAFDMLLRHGEKRMQPDEMKALTVANDGSAGFLAPTEYPNEILKKLVEWSPIRQYARVVSVSAKDVKYPRKLTGATAVWVDEIEDRTESSMSFEQVTITPFELATFSDISRQLLEDNAYDLQGELVADYSEAFGKAEAASFVSGNGVGKPRGILTAAGITEIKTGNAATLGTDPAATIIGMFHSLPGVHAQNGVWLMNRKTLGALRTLTDATGRFIMLDPITAGAPTTLLGRPVVEAVDFPDVGAGAFPIMFGDLQGYRIINRLDLNILPDPYTLAAKGQVRFHARARVGADVTHPDRFIKLKVAA